MVATNPPGPDIDAAVADNAVSAAAVAEAALLLVLGPVVGGLVQAPALSGPAAGEWYVLSGCISCLLPSA